MNGQDSRGLDYSSDLSERGHARLWAQYWGT
jgi:hypothetical protein